MREVRVRTDATGKHTQSVICGPHRLTADEPTDSGGEDRGPEPHEWVLAGLGACTTMTLQMYAHRKGWALRSVEVAVSGRRDGERFVITNRVSIEGDLDADQRARLFDIAGRCPVHRTLIGSIEIETVPQADAQ